MKDVLNTAQRYSVNVIARLEGEVNVLKIRIERLKQALERAEERFTDPTFKCVWLDAAEDCRAAIDSV